VPVRAGRLPHRASFGKARLPTGITQDGPQILSARADIPTAVAGKYRAPLSDVRFPSGIDRQRMKECVVSVALQQRGPLTELQCDGHRDTPPDFSRSAYCVQGLLCDLVTMEQATEIVVSSVREARRCNVATPNANFLRMIRSDPDFRDAVLASDLCLMDGMPLVWLARALGIAAPRRVAGSDLFDVLMRRSSGQISAFFLGGTDDVGRRLRERLNGNSLGVRCAGAYSPGFGDVDSMSGPEVIESINSSAADLLVVSIGANKGILWLSRNGHQLSIPVICNLGATINFAAGSLKRAPVFFRRYGLEWLWRIIKEPALSRRYACDLGTLAAVLARQVLPCLFGRALHSLSIKQPGVMLHHYEGTTEVLTFSGAWTKDNLAPVRAALAAATRRASDLALDIEGVTFVDPAFLGLILIAYGYQRRTQRGFLLRASNRSAGRMMRVHGCGFLLPEAGASAPRNPESWLVSGSGRAAHSLWRASGRGRLWSHFRQH
jgi:N-acetylglucosaminyldiphosphoundecaprenol N-acetyl-beta-D-mannosaminyltransferase